MKRLPIPIIILFVLAAFIGFFVAEVSAPIGEVKFRGIVATGEEWGGLVCYGSYYCSVSIEEILYDPENLLLVYEVSVCYNESLSLKAGDWVECYGFYWKEFGPLQCMGRVDCKADPYYVMLYQPPYYGPKAEFEAIPETAEVGEFVKFDASSSLSGWNGTHEMPITEYRWNFDDGNKTTTSTPKVYHSFSSSGVYYVTFTVYAPGATPETDSTTHKVNITEPPVGGYSLPIKGYTTQKPLTLYLALVAILTLVFSVIKRKASNKTK
jgi:hypothetical protein